MLKQCFLHGEKICLKYKTLMFSILSKTLIIREFAFEGESARKFALDFWGRTENSDGKTAGCRKSVSSPYCFHPDIENNADTGAIPQFFIIHRLVIRPQVFILQLWLSSVQRFCSAFISVQKAKAEAPYMLRLRSV